MRGRSILAIPALLLLLLPLTGCRTEKHGEGAQDARRDIAAGEPRLLTMGMPAFENGCLDEETGLPTSSIGCVVTDERGDYVSAYNAEVRRALEAGELKEHDLRHKVTTRAAIEARFETGEPIPIEAGGHPVRAPAGWYRVLVRVPEDDPDTPHLYAEDLRTGEKTELMFLGEGRARILFDHDGTTLLVRDGRYETWMTFDLPSGIFMQGFPDIE